MPIQENCRILEHRQVGPQHFKLTLQSAYIASHGLPGQFVNIKIGSGLFPLLRRPLSLHRLQKEKQLVELLYEVVGPGTEQLSQMTVGAEINLLGPLGKGFHLPKDKKIAILIGGGMGVAPLFFLAEEIKKDAVRRASYFLMGAKKRTLLVERENIQAAVDQLLLATDDGSEGLGGYVSDLLANFLSENLTASQYDQVALFACGPRPMLKAVAEIAFSKRLACQISLEERMACAIGACKGCAVQTLNGFKMVCSDGPVFRAEEILW